MPTPRPKSSIDLSPAEIEARTQAGVPLDADLTAQEIQAREVEKRSILARVAPVEEQQQTVAVNVAGRTASDIINALMSANAVATAAGREARRQEAEAVAQPLLTRLRAAMTSHGMLKAKWLDRVNAVAAQKLGDLLKATPQNLVFDKASRQMYSPTHKAIHRLHTIASTARDVLASTYGDAMPGKSDIDPVNAAAAAQAVENMISGDTAHDPVHGLLGSIFKRGISHLTVWTERVERLATSARDAVDRFVAAEEHAKKILKDVVPLSVEPTPKKAMLPKLESPPRDREATSYQDFEPRSSMRDAPPPSDGVRVERVGNSDGFRTEGGNR